jgi:hypothetical protein
VRRAGRRSPFAARERVGASEQLDAVGSHRREPLAEPHRHVPRPLERPGVGRASEKGGGRERGSLGLPGQVLDRDDLGDPRAVLAALAEDDEVDRFGDERGERAVRQVLRAVTELGEEPEAAERLARATCMDGREAGDARGQGEEERQRLRAGARLLRTPGAVMRWIGG